MMNSSSRLQKYDALKNTLIIMTNIRANKCKDFISYFQDKHLKNLCFGTSDRE